MSDLHDRTRTNQPSRDRFVAFAFAGADLLVEAQANGIITYAAGAFRAWFNRDPDSLVGIELETIIAPGDRTVLSICLAILAEHGRLAPVVLRLDDPSATPMAFAGLTLPGFPLRLCTTFSRLAQKPSAAADTALPATTLLEVAEARVRARASAGLGMIEVIGWSRGRATGPASQHQLQAEIVETVTRMAGPGAIAAEVAEGRYGVVGGHALDIRAVTDEIGEVIRKNRGGTRARVAGTLIPLEAEGLTGPQAARAVRFALTRFTEGGTAATNEAGFANGLAGFIADAQARAQAVRSAITSHRFRLAFQPIVTLKTRAVHHYEALLRPIPTPESPVRNTQEFVTFAEAVGLSEELDSAVLEQSLQAAKRSGAVIAVNVSGLSFQSTAFCERMLRQLALFDRPSQVMIELTETADLGDATAASHTVRWLRERGVRVCIDDFGAGSASLRYLRDLSVDFVKIDGAYVRRAPIGPREQGFVVSMAELAKFVGARVVAEMIETEEHARLMLEAGAELGQGWLFGKPGALPGSS